MEIYEKINFKMVFVVAVSFVVYVATNFNMKCTALIKFPNGKRPLQVILVGYAPYKFYGHEQFGQIKMLASFVSRSQLVG